MFPIIQRALTVLEQCSAKDKIHGIIILFVTACHEISEEKLKRTNTMDFVNNVVYDWGYQTSYGTFGHINYINNYFKAGPSTAGGYRYINISSGTAPENYKFYFSGNTMRNPDDTVYSTNMDEITGTEELITEMQV